MNPYTIMGKKIFLCNLGIEEEWNNDIFNDTQSKYKILNIEEIAMHISSEDDLCVVRYAPEEKFIQYMKELGFKIPKFLTLDSVKPTETFIEAVRRNREKIGELLKNDNMSIVAYAYTESLDIFGNDAVWVNRYYDVKKWNNKLYMHELLKEKGVSQPEGLIVHTKQEALEAYIKLRNKGFSREIIKMPYGASGKGSYLVNNESEAGILARICLRNSQNGILIEGFYDTAVNYSYQLNISDDKVSVFFMTEQIIEDTVYKGSYWGNELKNRINVPVIHEQAMIVGNVLRQAGVYGVVGIDGIMADAKCFPAIDVNVRHTMSLYLSNMSLLFGEDRSYMSWIKDMCLDKQMLYQDILNILEENSIKYDCLNREGIIVYIDGTLPKIKNEDEVYIGRIYAMCVASSYDDCLDYRDKFEKAMRKGCNNK